MHRDIKPSNILLTNNGDVKIADFGVSTQLNDTFDNRNSYVGTINWMAPEILEDDASYGLEVDIWSIGIMAIELAIGVVPYTNMTQFEVLKSIKESEPPKLIGNFSDSFKEFVQL
jgi:serine/threonine-protein kinase 24/25/MST4